MRVITSRFLADRSGATAVEYAVLTAMFMLTIFAGMEYLGNALVNQWTGIETIFKESVN